MDANDTLCAAQQSEVDHHRDNNVGEHMLLLAPRDKEEAFRLIEMIHNQKVEYLKKAIFELQRQNAVLNAELARCREDRSTDHKSEENMDVETIQKGTDIEELSSGFGDSEKVEHLEKKIKQLEKEVEAQKLLVQHQKLQVKSLLDNREQLREKFQKKLRSEKKKVSSEMQALLLEEKAKHLLLEANQGIQRSKQLELFVSTFHEKFQDLLLTAQAKSSQDRITALQRINELERKLTESLGSL